jgi:protein TonB
MVAVATMGPVVAGGWEGYTPDNRGVTRAVIASIVFHSLLFFTWQTIYKPTADRPKTTPGPIVARLAAPPALAPAPAPTPPAEEVAKPRAEETPPPPAPTPVVKPEVAPVAKPAPAAKAEAKPKPVPAKAAGADSPKAAVEPAPSAPAAPAEKPEPAAAAKPSPSAGPATSGDSDPNVRQLLGRYGVGLKGQMKRYMTYPRAAKENNWEGKLELALVIGENGMIAEIVVVKSSGHDVLDKAAMDAVRKAKPLVPIPEGLRGRAFRLEIPIEFNLADA